MSLSELLRKATLWWTKPLDALIRDLEECNPANHANALSTIKAIDEHRSPSALRVLFQTQVNCLTRVVTTASDSLVVRRAQRAIDNIPTIDAVQELVQICLTTHEGDYWLAGWTGAIRPESVRARAAKKLREIADQSGVVDALINGLSSDDSEVRSKARRGLSERSEDRAQPDRSSIRAAPLEERAPRNPQTRGIGLGPWSNVAERRTSSYVADYCRWTIPRVLTKIVRSDEVGFLFPRARHL